MRTDATRVHAELDGIGVTVGGGALTWMRTKKLPTIEGDRDIVAFHHGRGVVLVAEVEGDSSGQPEQKLYKAIGQAIMAVSDPAPPGWTKHVVIAVWGKEMARHLGRASALHRIGIAGVGIAGSVGADQWFFGNPLLSLAEGAA